MAKITKNWLGGNPSHRITATGPEGTYPILVEGMGGDPNTRLDRVSKLSAIIPVGTVFPFAPPAVVQSVDVEPVGSDPDKFVALINYGVEADATAEETSAGQISFSGSTLTEETTTDVNGTKIQTFYVSGDAGNLSLTTITHRMTVERPTLTVSLTRIESQIPKTVATNFLGSVNASTWSGYDSRTWLCRNIEVEQQGPSKFKARYQFVYKSDTWRARVTQRGSNGVVPNDVELNNGIALYDVYPLRDFNALGLSF